MEKLENNELIIINEENIKDLIYEIRGQKVMLDFDLARIYGYTTKAFNQQVKNNINKFPEDFRFELSNIELSDVLRSKKLTANNLSSKRRYNPYAFTEQGVYMLMTVLKGEIATKQSLALIRLFKSMKDYIVETNNLVTVNEVLKLSRQVNENTLLISKLRKGNELIENKLDIVMGNFIDPSTYKHFLILDGERIEADVAYQKIYSLAKRNLIIIDDYISVKTLELLKVCDKDIQITICSDNVARNKLSEIELEDFLNDTGMDIIIKPTNNRVHDRYIVIDYKTENETIYHSGGSSKDSGNKIITITTVENHKGYHDFIDDILSEH